MPIQHACEIVMEMHQVCCLLAVAEELNFTRAAERCNVTQPLPCRAPLSFSRRSLGGCFFTASENRRTSRILATWPDRIFSRFTTSRGWYARSQEFVTKWPLKLGIMSTISPDEIVDLIANIRTHPPDVDLRLCDASAEDLRARLLAGDLEVAIYALPGEEADERIHLIPLFPASKWFSPFTATIVSPIRGRFPFER